MNEKRREHTATLLTNGLVLVTGGEPLPRQMSPSKTAELYDPQTGTWRYTRFPMNVARTSHTATKLPNGKVLIAGGFNGSESLDTAEIFDPVTETFSATSSLSQRRRGHKAIAFDDGRVLVIGGYDDVSIGSTTGIVEIYNPGSGTWSGAGTFDGAAVVRHTVVKLPDGTVLTIGGYNGYRYYSHRAAVYRYNPGTNTWQTMAPLQVARVSHTATMLPDGKVLVVAGSDTVISLTSTEFYDPYAGANGQSVLGNPVDIGGRLHTATLMPNGNVLVAGGYDYPNPFVNPAVAVAKAQLFDRSTGTWSNVGPMTAARGAHTATLLPSGGVLIAGGFSYEDDSSSTILTSAELWGAPAADLAITQTASPNPVTAGSNITYTVTVSNNGPGTATPVVVTDNLPASTTFVSCSSTGSGVCGGAGNNRTVTFTSLTAGASATITIVARVNCSAVNGAVISNSVTITSATPDPNLADNSAMAETTVSGSVEITTCPRLSINPSSLNFSKVPVGGARDQYLIVTNVGGGALQGTGDTAAPFSLLTGSSVRLAAGGSIKVTVSFSPKAEVSSLGNVSFTSNGGNASVLLNGEGVEPVAVVLVHGIAGSPGSFSSDGKLFDGYGKECKGPGTNLRPECLPQMGHLL